MARALIVACGCRGRALGSRLALQGWSVRGTARTRDGAAAIESAGLEAALADPARPGTVLDLIGDVTVIHWLLGGATGDPNAVEVVHGDGLESLLAKLVDTPVRGFVYEAAGQAPERCLRSGAALVRAAADTWRIPVEVVDADPGDVESWTDAMAGATERLTGSVSGPSGPASSA